MSSGYTEITSKPLSKPKVKKNEYMLKLANDAYDNLEKYIKANNIPVVLGIDALPLKMQPLTTTDFGVRGDVMITNIRSTVTQVDTSTMLNKISGGLKGKARIDTVKMNMDTVHVLEVELFSDALKREKKRIRHKKIAGLIIMVASLPLLFFLFYILFFVIVSNEE